MIYILACPSFRLMYGFITLTGTQLKAHMSSTVVVIYELLVTEADKRWINIYQLPGGCEFFTT